MDTPANPVRAGSELQFFITGQGAVEGRIESGAAAPSVAPFAAPMLPIGVTIGDLPAKVLFAGLAPGTAGVLRIDVEIPLAVTRAYEVKLAVTVGSQPASGPVVVSVR